MAEGPLVHSIARRLDRVLSGRVVDVEFSAAKLADAAAALSGRRLERVEAWGKQFRIRFPEDRVLLVHLLMWGTWRVYRRGAEWDRPAEKARVVLRSDEYECVVFGAPVVQVMGAAELESSRWGGLGPDPLRDDWDEAEFFRRLDTDPLRQIGEVIMDQHVLAGVGNMLRVEILWRCGLHPERTIGSLGDDDRRALLDWTIELMRRWLARVHGKKDWLKIYRRSGKPCPRCGCAIEFSRQASRVTYHCPRCQPERGGAPPARTQHLFLP